MKKLILILSAVVALAVTSNAHAEKKMLDQVVAIVDQNVILQSEVDALIHNVKANAALKGQSLPSDRVLRTQAIERLINSSLQVQIADRMGLQISDAQLDQTIANIAAQDNMTVEELKQDVEKRGENFEKYRENVREEIVISEVRRGSVQRRVYVSLQEVDSLLKLMAKHGQTNEEFHIGHILIDFPSQPDAKQVEEAKDRAQKVLDLLNNGSDFKRIAITSSGGAKALEGGDMGWLNENEMPTLFAEAIKGKKKGDIIGPFRSGAGFHILTIFDIRGREVVEIKEVNARHILVKPSVILSEEKAKQTLMDAKKQIESGDAEFAALAKELSEDPGSALKGGELGFAEPSKYVPAFKNAIERLESGQISEPFRSSHGWHIVEVLEKRTQDATEIAKKDKAYRIIFNRKFAEESASWLRELRGQAYIEILENE
ncbi:peptidylprolyl isomerase SurA [Flocculibacter collagenilyticus]|uniref:peptidylprolyl isomerase SurA n=1 Tax=Flocculibacter collagenilyticus TaxID=2744479 RepID=UPI0018F4E7B2|nr:peptidylprolyl isomerase SurA [Flocculibacter collagenilyticus]